MGSEDGTGCGDGMGTLGTGFGRSGGIFCSFVCWSTGHRLRKSKIPLRILVAPAVLLSIQAVPKPDAAWRSLAKRVRLVFNSSRTSEVGDMLGGSGPSQVQTDLNLMNQMN